MKKETKQKIRNKLSKLKKPLMILSIVFNILFAFALVIGLSSNNKRTQSVSATEAGFTNLSNTEWVINSSVVLPIDDYSFMINFSSNDVNFTQMSFDNEQERINYNTTIAYRFGLWNNEAYRYIQITSGADVTNTILIEWLLNNATLNSLVETNEAITLGDSFNPVVYVTQNGNYILNGFAGYHQNPSTNFIDFTGLIFESNGQIFNRIRFMYLPLPAGAPIVTQDGTSYIDTSGDFGDYISCFGMFYQYVDNGSVTLSVQVTSYRRTIITDNEVNINAYDVRQPYVIWLNNNYRTLNIIGDTGEVITGEYLTISGLSAKELLQINTSVNDSVMGMSDVFGLLKGAFNGITGILAISILPGITLGLLLFIPLIVTIIITVVRLIKK